MRLLGPVFDRFSLSSATLSSAVAGRTAASPLGLSMIAATATAAGTAGRLDASDVVRARPAESPRPAPPHADALRLAVHLRAAIDGATGQSLLLCGVRPAASVRRLTYEIALAFAHVQHVPVLVVDLEPDDTATGGLRGLLPEIDPAAWPDLGDGQRPAVAVACISRRRQRRGYLTSVDFGRDLAAWRAAAGIVLCCAEPLPDSVDTLAVATQCTGTILVVPAKGAAIDATRTARQTCTRAGVRLLGCVIDDTPAARPARGRKGA